MGAHGRGASRRERRISASPRRSSGITTIFRCARSQLQQGARAAQATHALRLSGRRNRREPRRYAGRRARICGQRYRRSDPRESRAPPVDAGATAAMLRATIEDATSACSSSRRPPPPRSNCALACSMPNIAATIWRSELTQLVARTASFDVLDAVTAAARGNALPDVGRSGPASADCAHHRSRAQFAAALSARRSTSQQSQSAGRGGRSRRHLSRAPQRFSASCDPRWITTGLMIASRRPLLFCSMPRRLRIPSSRASSNWKPRAN